MANNIRLKEVAKYSESKINIKNVTLDNYITTDNLLQNKLGMTRAESLPPQTENMTSYFKENILIGNIRPYLKKIWFADKEGGNSADVLTLQVNNEHVPKFIYYALHRNDFFVHMMKGSKGTKMPRGDKDHIMDFIIPDIPKVLESKIASILSSLDEKIEFNNKINKKLEAITKLIYNYWFIQFDFPDKNGNPYKSSGGKMVYNKELKHEIPYGWSNGTLNDLGEIVGGSTPSTENTANFIENGTPWITPNDLSSNIGNKFITRGQDDVSDIGIKSASLQVYPKNTVLMSSRAPIGYMAIARESLTTNQGFKSFIPNKEYSSEFIFLTVKNSMKAVIQYSSGSTFKEVSGTLLKTVKVSLPKTDISDLYTKRIKNIFERQNLLELENMKLSEQRDWLLPMLMNGQISITSD